MKGIRVMWTRRREEYMEAYLTFEQVRARFGLGGTPDKLVSRRMGQVANQAEIIAAAEELGEAVMVNHGGYSILNLRFDATSEMRSTEQHSCPMCKRPLPDDEPPF